MVSGGPGGKYISLLSLQRVNNIGIYIHTPFTLLLTVSSLITIALAILLSHFKMSFEEIYNGIMMMDESVLSIDNIKALCYIAPREDEVLDSSLFLVYSSRHDSSPTRLICCKASEGISRPWEMPNDSFLR